MPGQELLCGVNAESTKETDEAIWDQEFSLEESRGDKIPLTIDPVVRINSRGGGEAGAPGSFLRVAIYR